MKSLYLLRHAKSSWKDPGLDDHDRPLNKRGRQAAKIMATYLRRSEITPDVVICSTATRAKETLDPIVKRVRAPQPRHLASLTGFDALFGALRHGIGTISASTETENTWQYQGGLWLSNKDSNH